MKLSNTMQAALQAIDKAADEAHGVPFAHLGAIGVRASTASALDARGFVRRETDGDRVVIRLTERALKLLRRRYAPEVPPHPADEEGSSVAMLRIPETIADKFTGPADSSPAAPEQPAPPPQPERAATPEAEGTHASVRTPGPECSPDPAPPTASTEVEQGPASPEVDAVEPSTSTLTEPSTAAASASEGAQLAIPWSTPDDLDGWRAVTVSLAGALSHMATACTGGTLESPCLACMSRALLNEAQPGAAALPTPCLVPPSEPGSLARWSTLRAMLISPLACRHLAETGRADTDALRLGRLVHLAVLQPERFETDVLVEPDHGNLRTKEGRAARAAWWAEIAPDVEVTTSGDVARALANLKPGIEVAGAHEHARALACSRAVRSHPAAAALLDGALTEVELEWERMGVGCGGRLDILRPDCVVDLKTTRHASLRDVQRDFANHAYHGQLAWYHDGAIRAGRRRRDAGLPKVIAVQTSPPYDVAVLEMDTETLDAGLALCDAVLAQWVGCVEADWWPGMAPDIVTWRLPNWAPGMVELAQDNEVGF